MAVPHTLGFRLAQARREKAAREQRDIRQQDVAEAVGASRASVSKWESDTDTPREAVLAKLAEFLGVTPAFLRYGIRAEPAAAPASSAFQPDPGGRDVRVSDEQLRRDREEEERAARRPAAKKKANGRRRP